MFFSSRLPSNRRPNDLSLLLDRLRRDATPFVDLTESNPTRAGFAYPVRLLSPLASPDNLAYYPEPLGLSIARAAVSRDFARRGLSIPADRIVLTASTSESYSLLFKLLCDPGDRVLVPVPSYPLFDYLTRLDGVEAAPYPLRFDGRWSIDMTTLAERITSRTRAILVVNPNNPTGSYVSEPEMSELRRVCAAHGLALIGDEVFADYPIELPCETSVLDSDEVLTFGFGGLSKAAGLPQLKLGWMAIRGPVSDVAVALDGLEIICDTYLSVATPVQTAAPALLEAAEVVRAQIQTRVRENLEVLIARCVQHPSIALLPCEGGWYAVLRVPRVAGGEEELVQKLLAEHGILVHPGFFFDFPHEAFLVISLLPPTPTFQSAVECVLAVASRR